MKIEPCPFCQYEPTIIDEGVFVNKYRISCFNPSCLIDVSQKKTYSNLDTAIIDWNDRSATFEEVI